MKTILITVFTILGITSFSQETIPYIIYLEDSVKLYVHPENNAIDIPWGGYGIEITAGNGAEDQYCGIENTAAIVEQLGDNGGIPYAAKICDTLSAYGHDDWYLPSFYELYFICEEKDSLGLSWIGNGSYLYWTSLEIDENQSLQINIPSFCQPEDMIKNSLHNCRCVRREALSDVKENSKVGSPVISYDEISDEIRISHSITSIEMNLEIFDINGRNVLSQSNIFSGSKIDISFLKAGTYIVKVHGDSSVVTQKIIKR